MKSQESTWFGDTFRTACQCCWISYYIRNVTLLRGDWKLPFWDRIMSTVWAAQKGVRNRTQDKWL